MENQKKRGLISNFLYALNMERKSNKKLLLVTLIMPLATIIYTLMQSYAPKYILSFIENDLPINQIIFYIIIIGLISYSSGIIDDICYSLFEFEYRKTEGFLEKIRMNKLFHTDFKNMESPDFMDYSQRAKTALYRGNGFHGVLYESRNLMGQGALTIIAAVLIGRQNIVVMILITMMSVSIAKILSFVAKRDKVKFSDTMAPVYRKISYLEETTKNFDFAKDIRLFTMSNNGKGAI